MKLLYEITNKLGSRKQTRNIFRKYTHQLEFFNRLED